MCFDRNKKNSRERSPSAISSKIIKLYLLALIISMASFKSLVRCRSTFLSSKTFVHNFSVSLLQTPRSTETSDQSFPQNVSGSGYSDNRRTKGGEASGPPLKIFVRSCRILSATV